MQSDQDTFKRTTPLSTSTPTTSTPATSHSHNAAPSAPPPDAGTLTYTPRTVWQTPHGLPPNFNRHRNPRPNRVAKIMQRCLRLMYRVKRLSQATAAKAAARHSAHVPLALS
jgi:hypothetical protein